MTPMTSDLTAKWGSYQSFATTSDKSMLSSMTTSILGDLHANANSILTEVSGLTFRAIETFQILRYIYTKAR